jgi:hypothetical protein
MPIDREKIRDLAATCWEKKFAMLALHERNQKEDTAETAALFAVARAEYYEAKNILDKTITEGSHA